MLSEKQCRLIEDGLTQSVEPRKVAAYLCLHMGLMLSEVTALQWKDIDLDTSTLTLRCSISATLEPVPLDPPRALHMPPHVIRYLQQHRDIYEDSGSYILTGEKNIPAFHHMQNILTAVALKTDLGCTLSASDLRSAFIRRCIQSDMDLYSLCAYIGIKQPNAIVKRYAEFFQPKFNCVDILEKFSADYVPPEPESLFKGPKRMNLLILGAGGQGHVVKETAEDIGVFNEIAFLDDNTSIPGVIDTLGNLEKYVEEYPVAFVAIGKNNLRCSLIERLESAGYIVPVLRHPTATISPTVKAGAGTIFEAKVIVNASVQIGKGVILASACVIDHGVVIGDYVHVDVGAMVKKNSRIAPFTKVASGSIFNSEQDRED